MKVGEYVRTSGGYIDKITDIRLQTKYTKYNTLYFENKIGEILFTDKELKEMKSSPNIIDLIEVGDYVNGQEVRYIDKGNGYCYLAIDEDYTYLIAGYDKDGLTMPIKSIVTHEQFSQIEYRIGE